MTNAFNCTQVSTFVKELLNSKCSNYGYDYKDFKRISSQRSKARKEFLNFASWNMSTLIERVQIESRVQTGINGELHYIVGQSANEEITNLMRRLVNPKAKWAK